MFLSILFFLSLANADSLANCHDGDTCRFKTANGIKNVRFSGIDAPEKGQASGSKATAFMTKLLIGKTIALECTGKSFDREVCTVFADGEDIQMKMVEAGWAWNSPSFSHGKYTIAQKAARTSRLGLSTLR